MNYSGDKFCSAMIGIGCFGAAMMGLLPLVSPCRIESQYLPHGAGVGEWKSRTFRFINENREPTGQSTTAPDQHVLGESEFCKEVC